MKPWNKGKSIGQKNLSPPRQIEMLKEFLSNANKESMAFKRSKYKAIKSNGYDSKKEHKEALELKLLEKAGIIKDLVEQPKFELLASFRDNQGKLERSICYIGDFQYYDNEKKCVVVKDTKSEFTRKLPVYSIKRKMFKAKYPNILFLESVK